MRCASERIFNLHVEQHDSTADSTDSSHFSGWPRPHFLTAPGALAMQPGVVARNAHDHSLFLLLHCLPASARVRDVVARSQARCVSGGRRVSVTVAVAARTWQSWTGSLPSNMKDFPAKAGCDGQLLFPAQSVHDIVFAIKCDDVADGQAAVDSILVDLGDHVESKLLVRAFKFDGGKDLTGDVRRRQSGRLDAVSRSYQDFGTGRETLTTACEQL
jgi:hypothetical protein